MAAYHQKGRTAIRDFLEGLFTHVGLAEDTTAFNDSQTVLNPGGGTSYIAAATASNVDADTNDYAITVTSAQYGDVDVATVGLNNGSAVDDTISRQVRSRTIGIEAANDQLTIAVRVQTQDAS